MIEFKSQRLTYKILSSDDITEAYVSWLNDPKINRYLEIRHKTQSLEDCHDFVKQMEADQSQFLFGIFSQDNEQHIGNIKLGYVDNVHKRAQLSLFIGDSSYWGKGIATEAIDTITQWGFDSLALERIEAGCCEENIASIRAFLNTGYQIEGYFREHGIVDGKRMSSFWLGILKHEKNSPSK